MKIRVIFFGIILFGVSLLAQTTQRPQGNGLSGYYYQGYAYDSSRVLDMSNLTLSFSRIDTSFDIWNGDRYFAWQPVPGWPNNYSVEWKGFIFIDETGRYGFGTISDDGSQILIDGKMIVDNGESQWYDWEDNISEGDTPNTPFPPLFLNKGFHEITIKFAEFASYDGIQVWWIKPSVIDSSDIPWYGQNFHATAPYFNPSTNWEIVPKAVLFTTRKKVPIAHNDSLYAREDSVIVFNPVLNDWDPDSSGIYLSGYDSSNHGLVQFVNDSTLSYKPGKDFFGTDSFHYFITDDFGQADTALVLITVTNVQDKPSDFHLISPADSSEINYIDPNIRFTWSAAKDADQDTLTYFLKIFNNHSDTTVVVNSDTSYNLNSASFLSEMGYFKWTVWVNDKSFTVSADTLTFYVSIFLSIANSETDPLSFKLYENYPNPFNPSTIISYQLPVNSDVKLVVYDILGREIKTILDERQPAGSHKVIFNAENLSNGLYFYKLKAGEFVQVKRMMLIK